MKESWLDQPKSRSISDTVITTTMQEVHEKMNHPSSAILLVLKTSDTGTGGK